METAVEELTTSEGWRALVTSRAWLRRYSLNNVLLILNQCPHATDVRTFGAWLNVGRAVRTGEQGLRIREPLRYRAEADETEEPVAVMTVEVFALPPETDTTLTTDQQFTVDLLFTATLATLNDHTGPDMAVFGCDVTPYESGALIQLLTMAPSADHVTDEVAKHLDAAMAEDSELFAGWELAAGSVAVLCSDN